MVHRIGTFGTFGLGLREDHLCEGLHGGGFSLIPMIGANKSITVAIHYSVLLRNIIAKAQNCGKIAPTPGPHNPSPIV